MGSNRKVDIWNHLVYVGKYTYTSAQNGKYFNTVEQLLDGLTGQGRSSTKIVGAKVFNSLEPRKWLLNFCFFSGIL